MTADNRDAEGLPIVLLEAQACGVPVVTSARGGADEGILDGQTGFAFVERDVASLADHLERLLVEDALWERFSEAAPRFISAHFDIVQCTKRLTELYDEIARNGLTR